MEGIDFDQTSAHVARLESIRILLSNVRTPLALIVHFWIVNFKMCVLQPKGFENPHFPGHVYKLKGLLYGLSKLLELDTRN